MNPLGHAAGRLGRAVDSAQMPVFKKKFFSFSNPFYKLQIKFEFQ
jgi:hypothetical protein